MSQPAVSKHVRVLERAGHDVWVYDNLVYGHREAARPDRLIVGDLLETERLTDATYSRIAEQGADGQDGRFLAARELQSRVKT